MKIIEYRGLMDANGVSAPIADESNEGKNESVFLTPIYKQRGKWTIRDFQSLVGILI